MACAVPDERIDIEVPILEEENIIDSIKAYINIPFSVSELRNPTPEKLQTMYGAFVCCLLEVSNEQITQIPLHVMESISNQQMHLEEGAGYIQFIKILGYFFDLIGINDFTLNDIIKPKKKRTRRLLSAMVNYAQFAQSYSNAPKLEITKKMEAMRKEQEVFVKKRKDLLEKIGNLKTRRLERQRAVQELNLNEMKANLEQLELLKKEKLANNSRVQAEVDELKNSLTIGRSSRLIKEGEEAVEICKTRTHALIVKEELVNKFEEVIPSALQWVKDVEVEAVALAKLRNQLEEADDRLLELSKADKTTVARIQNMESLIKGKQEKKELLIAKSIEMDKLLKDTELRLMNKKIAVQEDMKKRQEEIRTNREDIEQTEKLMCLYKEEHEETMKTLEAKRKSLEISLGALNDKILSYYSSQLSLLGR